MPFNRYITISSERYETIYGRYLRFAKCADDPTTEPCKVFDPLSEKQIQELEMIRQVSRDLVIKKNKDFQTQQTRETGAKMSEIAVKHIETKVTTKETPIEA